MREDRRGTEEASGNCCIPGTRKRMRDAREDDIGLCVRPAKTPKGRLATRWTREANEQASDEDADREVTQEASAGGVTIA